MAYSIWIYLNSEASHDKIELLQKLGGKSCVGWHTVNHAEGTSMLELKIDKHLLAFPEDFISKDFLAELAPYISKISMLTFDPNYPKIHATAWTLGETKLSYDNCSILVKGKSFEEIFYLYNTFKANDGDICSYNQKKDLLESLKNAAKHMRITNFSLDVSSAILDIQIRNTDFWPEDFEQAYQEVMKLHESMTEKNNSVKKLLKMQKVKEIFENQLTFKNLIKKWLSKIF